MGSELLRKQHWLCLVLCQCQQGCSAGTWQGALLLGGTWQQGASQGRCRVWRKRAEGHSRAVGRSRQALGIFVRTSCSGTLGLHGKHGMEKGSRHKQTWAGTVCWYLACCVCKLGCRIWPWRADFQACHRGWGEKHSRVRLQLRTPFSSSSVSEQVMYSAVVHRRRGTAQEPLLWVFSWLLGLASQQEC